MDEVKIKSLQDILLVERLLDTAHDKKLISYEDLKKYHLSLNDKTHKAINALLA